MIYIRASALFCSALFKRRAQRLYCRVSEKGLAVGLMSGTSADGVTAALVRFSASRVEVLRCKTFPYSTALRRRVLAAVELKTPELSRLNMELGEVFARAAVAISKGAKPKVV